MTGPALTLSSALQSLRLNTAQALLGEAAFATLPPQETQPQAYLQALIDGLCGLSLQDALTACANRRQLQQVMTAELDRVVRSGDMSLLLMIDIDKFKHINDQYGHNAGDQVLQAVAKALRACIRPMDTLARFGGEEFAIILPACQPAYGAVVAERLRMAIERLRIFLNPVQSITVTASIGGAYALQWIRSTPQLWTERADQQLYLAKHHGRNRISIEKQPDSTVTAEEKNLLFSPSLTSCTFWTDDGLENLSFPAADMTDGVN